MCFCTKIVKSSFVSLSGITAKINVLCIFTATSDKLIFHIFQSETLSETHIGIVDYRI